MFETLAAKVIAGVVGFGVLLGAATGLYFYVRHQGVMAERPKTELAADNGSARALEASGERATAQRVDTYVHVVSQAEKATSALQQAAGAAPDASSPLPLDRVARLRANDDVLCGLAPDLDGCSPATAGAAPGG